MSNPSKLPEITSSAPEPADPPWPLEAAQAIYKHEVARVVPDHHAIAWNDLSVAAQQGRLDDLRAGLPTLRERIELDLRQKLAAEVDRLRGELTFAAEELEDMVPYVGDYLREKWGYDKSIARVRAALAAPAAEQRS